MSKNILIIDPDSTGYNFINDVITRGYDPDYDARITDIEGLYSEKGIYNYMCP